MKKWYSDEKTRKTIGYVLEAAIFIMAAFVRLYRLGSVPGGINQDEAYAGYEALSLLRSGMDSRGYPFPVYFVSWGSGMNVMNSYLMIPFVASWGLNTVTMRLPQAMVGILTVIAVYRIAGAFLEKQKALFIAFLIAVAPWHIMLSRWGLESNLAPGFITFGLLFFVLGMTKSNKYYALSACFYGMSLYCYATIWVVVPFLILLQVLYAVYVRRLRWDRWTLLAGIILICAATPLLLFLLINKGVINEIVLPFLSIPQLAGQRMQEVSLSNLGAKWIYTFKMLWNQNDNLYWNSTAEYGLYYKGMLVFAPLGLLAVIRGAYLDLKHRRVGGSVLLLIQFVVAMVLGGLIYVNVNKINCIHLSILALIAIGILTLTDLLRKKVKLANLPVFILLFVLLIRFERFYDTEYNDNISHSFQAGVVEAVRFADALAGGEEPIYVNGILHPKVLFAVQPDTVDYVTTVRYPGEPSAFMYPTQFCNYVWYVTPDGREGVFVLPVSDQNAYYEEMGYRIAVFDTIEVVYK